MNANSAKLDLNKPRRIATLIYPDVTLLDVAGPTQVFSSANDLAGEAPLYETVLVSRNGGPVRSDTGVALDSIPLQDLSVEGLDTLLVAGGSGVFEALRDSHLVEWTGRSGRRTRRAGSTCMGAMLTAAAGLHDGRRVVTHWRWCDELARRRPAAKVEVDPIFINDGGIWSAAGVSAGIDLALAMVEEDHGRDLSMAIARSLVVYLKRSGGQSQFSAVLEAQSAPEERRLQDLVAWIEAHLDRDLKVEELAARVHMSPRTFARRFSRAFGETPGRAVERLRIERARRLLETTAASLPEVAAHSGLKTYDRLRAAFMRQMGVSPAAYRDGFGPG